MPISQTLLGDLTVIEIIIGVVISLLVANQWQKFFDAFFYRTLCLDRRNAYVTFVLALTITLAFFFYLYSVGSFTRELLLGGSTDSGKTSQILGDQSNGSEVLESPPCSPTLVTLGGNCCVRKKRTHRRKKRRDVKERSSKK